MSELRGCVMCRFTVDDHGEGHHASDCPTRNERTYTQDELNKQLAAERKEQAEIAARIYAHCFSEEQVNKQLAGMRELYCQHIPWSDGKCTCSVVYTSSESLDPFEDFRKHIRQLPNSAADAGVKAIEERVKVITQRLIDDRDSQLQLWMNRARKFEAESEAIERRVLERVAAACDSEGYIHRSEILALKEQPL